MLRLHLRWRATAPHGSACEEGRRTLDKGSGLQFARRGRKVRDDANRQLLATADLFSYDVQRWLTSCGIMPSYAAHECSVWSIFAGLLSTAAACHSE